MNKNCIQNCPLCSNEGELFNKSRDKRYYSCSKCKSIFMDKRDYLSPEKELTRYKEHNNNVEDVRYQNFVLPIVNAVKLNYGVDTLGLDYGCGTGPVISKMLEDCGYSMLLYDPFFADFPENLEKKYNFIACCEVMEHFYYPKKEFIRLKSLLKEDGKLFMKTKLYSENIDFNSWNYKNDPTHVFFYSTHTINWISDELNFKDVIIKDDYIEYLV